MRMNQDHVEHIATLFEFQSGSKLTLCLIQPPNKPQSCHVALGVVARDPSGSGTHLEGEIEISPAKLSNQTSMENLFESLLDQDHKPKTQEMMARFDQATPALGDRLWELLGDIPTDNHDQIDIDFAGFSKGTDREQIWHWFESTFDLSVAQKMGFCD